MSATTTLPTPAPQQSLDDVMLAMDIVDTLRHRELILEKELSGAERKVELVKRLKEIYSAQGIEVSDRILEDGVKALEEQRFIYEPPKDGLSVRLAKVYIARDRWLKPFAFVAGLALFATAAYEFGFDNPREAQARKAQVELTLELPAELAAARDAALKLAENDAARSRIEASFDDGVAAAKDGRADAARAAISDLSFLASILKEGFIIRVVSRPGEYSSVFRIPDNAPNARNYYLIVEAVDSRGRARPLEIESEEDQQTARVEKWGVRVSESTFNAVAADKADDQIIQHADIGEKPRGALTPVYQIDAGGAILEW